MSRRYFQSVKHTLDDFSGGLSLRDPFDVAGNQLPLLTNGFVVGRAIKSRGGSPSRFSIAGGGWTGQTIINGIYWKQANLTVLLTSDGKLWYGTGSAPSLFTLAHTFTTTELTTWVIFKGELIGAHPTDGIWSLTTGGVWALITAAVKCRAISAWQNKCWATADSVFSSRVWWSNAGDAHTWTTASDFNDIREIDDEPCIGIGAGQGMDILGRPSLLVYKQNSNYRINNSTTGAYTTLDTSVGCVHPLAIGNTGHLIGFLHTSGFYVSDGLNPPKRVSGPLDRMFPPMSVKPMSWMAVSASVATWDHKFAIALTLTNTTYSMNDTLAVYDELTGSWSLHDYSALDNIGVLWSYNDVVSGLPSQLFASYGQGKSDARQIMAYPGGFDRKADNTLVPITVKMETPWLELGGGSKFNLRHVRVHGRTNAAAPFTVYPMFDYNENLPAARTLQMNNDSKHQTIIGDMFSLGRGKAVKLRLEATSSNVFTNNMLPLGPTGQGEPHTALHALRFTAIPLGES